jgi:hypothetical protein
MRVVFVHIGENPTPTLYSAAEVAKLALPDAEIFLISDQKRLLKSFSGTGIEFNTEAIQPFLSHFIKKNKELKNLAGGYWLNTLMRLFALNQVAQLNPLEPILHLESDVYLYAQQNELQKFEFSQDLVSYPRLSGSRGVASILYSPNSETLLNFLRKLSAILIENQSIVNDMDLLGFALNADVAMELPSTPHSQEERGTTRYIFDGAALGQYLLGIDPIHTNGSVTSGYQNADYKFDISSFKWSIPQLGKLIITIQNKDYQILNLHAHSKEILGIPDPTNLRWKQILHEANGEQPREVLSRKTINFHIMKPSFRDRIRIGRKAGFFFYSMKYLNRKIKWVSSRYSK